MGARPENSVQDLFLALRTLCRRVDFLTSRVSHLETLLEERPEIGWTVVSEESLPLESGYYGSRFSEVEEGPPPLPTHLLEFAVHLTAGPGSLVRAERAWTGGFWCGVALRTFTSFSPVSDIGVFHSLGDLSCSWHFSAYFLGSDP